MPIRKRADGFQVLTATFHERTWRGERCNLFAPQADIA
jgi:hypothetical protein